MEPTSSPFRGLRLLWLAFGAFSLFTLISCVTLQDNGKSVFLLTTPEQESSLGASSFADLKRQVPVSPDPVANEQVRRVVQRLAAQAHANVAEWEVAVFQDPTPNAFALPGGKIGVHTGILPLTQTDAGLAAVIGHEMAHVSLRHGGQRMTQQMISQMGVQALGTALEQNNWKTNQYMLQAVGAATQLGWILPFSRGNELEADRVGLRYMAQAGYDPREAVIFWQRMADMSAKSGSNTPEYFSTHPSDARRISQIQSLLPEALQSYKQAGGAG